MNKFVGGYETVLDFRWEFFERQNVRRGSNLADDLWKWMDVGNSQRQ